MVAEERPEMTTVYAKSDSQRPCVVQPSGGQSASPGEPLQSVTPNMAQTDLLVVGFLQKGRGALKELEDILVVGVNPASARFRSRPISHVYRTAAGPRSAGD